jgi:hypothetical protein
MFWNENDWSKYDCLSCGCDREIFYIGKVRVYCEDIYP